ncbi:MAG: CPBP family intramembrane metalloprotease [Clostridia bacterium]|nr:CPBP family intramembrane metalloprotease [Clostridia bacterium]
MDSRTIKPAPLWQSLCFFGISSILIITNLYVIMPHLLASGIPFLTGYFILFYTPFLLLFVTEIIFYKRNIRKLSWESFKGYFRIKKLNRKTLFWTIGLFLFWLVSFFGLGFTQKLIAEIPFFNPPSYFPPEINPLKSMVSGELMGTPLEGNWWIIIVCTIGWFFNIFGEELLFRGYLLPRQEMKYGKHAWIINGVLWTLWHSFWRWQLIPLFFTCMSLSFVAQKTQSTLPGIIVHGVLNFIPIIMMITWLF